MEWLFFVGLLLLAYLLGSFPTGLVLGLWFKGIDIREYGSGKTGATNSLRTLGWKISLAVFILDGVKGAISLLVPALFFTDRPDDWLPWVRMICAFVCMMGHNFSIWIKFGGGRGVAVGVGELLVISPIVWILSAIVTIPTIAISRYVSLGSIVGSIVTVIFTAVVSATGFLDWRYMGFSIVAASTIIIMHRDNITRLMKGTERKLGDKAAKVQPDNTHVRS
jgi:glycerol-3-phosphate acyltransferase PlsY